MLLLATASMSVASPELFRRVIYIHYMSRQAGRCIAHESLLLLRELVASPGAIGEVHVAVLVRIGGAISPECVA
jgi:hypothetical protein